VWGVFLIDTGGVPDFIRLHRYVWRAGLVVRDGWPGVTELHIYPRDCHEHILLDISCWCRPGSAFSASAGVFFHRPWVMAGEVPSVMVGELE
jgi:hypothetical protein